MQQQHLYQNDRDWSKLYPELLQLISKHILDIFDFVHFRAVCKGWRTATVASASSLQPCLFTQHRKEGTNFYLLTSTSQWTKFKVPIIRTEKLIGGSSQGYMLIMDRKKRTYYLLNPITGKEIHLPPLDERFYNLVDVELDEGVPKFVAVCKSGFEQYCFHTLRICQIGDEKWTKVYRMCNSACTMSFYKSSVLIISEFGRKVIDEKPGVTVSIITPPKTKSRITLCNPCGNASNLVGITVNDPLEFEFMLFEIFLLDCENSNTRCRWIKTNNIGDQVLFWKLGKCISWKTDDSSMYKRSSVYYKTSKGLGRFDIENATAEILQREPPGHMWFTPNLV